MTQIRAAQRLVVHVQLMGIVNRTPDSFSDGGRFINDDAAQQRVDQLISAGAEVVDVGAESTRPGAALVGAEQQIARLGSIFSYIAARGACASVDTTLPEVAAFALKQGARMVNSVSLDAAAELGALAARYDAELVLMHSRGSMDTMGGFSSYREDGYADVVHDVVAEWRPAATAAMQAGLRTDQLIFDPGLGFMKSAKQSLALCARLPELRAAVASHRILMGPSRKSYLAPASTGAGNASPSATDRLGASVAAALDCAAHGADILRVHDVHEVAQALRYLHAVEQQRNAALPSGGARV